ncbi:adenylate/guanylate cyclase domain-containing protein [Brevibacterium marinum]|uniref:Class 3 adenylate cyclase n=1 Tax=Brevibacterium marinum TaxID=418643 RepID=A0A846RUY2_9MICO|nr:adenylate/guanylate cyclase domain-containing protein [Brevibacterium marinum]NJC57974.1 class 3 adenylate cyclase [Brevibacterium marinum]
MTGISDFTAEFDVVPDRSQAAGDDNDSAEVRPDGHRAEGNRTEGEHNASIAADTSEEHSSSAARESTDSAEDADSTDDPDTAEYVADADDAPAADHAQDAGQGHDTERRRDAENRADSGLGPNSIPMITEDRIDASPNAAEPPAASAPPSVPGIEHGDEDLPATSAMNLPRAEELGTDEATSAQTAGGDFSDGLHEDPRTAALQMLDDDDDDEDETVYETRSAAERLEEILLDGKRVLDRREAAKLGGISTVSARKMWRALGMSQTDEAEKAYTVSDAHALRMWAKPVADGLIDQSTALSLARAIGQTTDRLVVWQMETLVDFLTEEKGLTDPEARRDALRVVEDMVDPLQMMLTYSWRRNLAEVMGRLNVNVSDGLAIDNRQGWYDSSMPLARAVGFIDLVSYTRLSQKMEPRQLANLVQEFQGMAYNIVATGGGRVIKTVGDEVFFAAETPLGGAEIAMTLMEKVSAAENLPQARVGFVWGRVLSRLGDIFGSSVNLAARLTAVADPGTIFTDEDTARVLSASDAYVFERRESLSLQGLGETGIGEMRRGTAARMQLDLDDDES